MLLRCSTFLGIALLLAAAPAHAAPDGTVRFRGDVYDEASGAPVYTENHEQHWARGQWLSGSVIFTAPDGTLLGRKTLDFSQDPFVPLVRTDHVAGGYEEAITDARGPIVMQRRTESGEEPASRSIRKDGAMVADAGLGKFIVAHFDELLGGKTLRFKLAAPSQLDSFRFRVRRIEDTSIRGRKAVQFRIDLDSLLRIFTGPMEVAYDPDLREMIEFRGPTGVIDPKTGKRYKDVRVEYSAKHPP